MQLVHFSRPQDASFHINILPAHWKFLRFAFEGTAYEYLTVPFGLARASRTFSKCVYSTQVSGMKHGFPCNPTQRVMVHDQTEKELFDAHRE